METNTPCPGGAFESRLGGKNSSFPLTLPLSTRSLRDSVEVKVSDNGKGIPQSHLKKVFDPFFTTKKIGEGTGLGLYIVYRILTKYEGTIDVESKEGIGTTFTIKFPIRRDE